MLMKAATPSCVNYANRAARVTDTEKFIEETISGKDGFDDVFNNYGKDQFSLSFRICARKLLELFADKVNKAEIKGRCNHEWISAKNEVVTSGLICLKCNSIKAEVKGD